MPAIVVIHRLKDFDAWYTQFKANPPPKIGRWRVLRGSTDRNRVHVVGEMTDAEVKGVKEFIRVGAHEGRVCPRQRNVDRAGRSRLAGRVEAVVGWQLRGAALILRRRAVSVADQRKRRPEQRMCIGEDHLLGVRIDAPAFVEHVEHGGAQRAGTREARVA